MAEKANQSLEKIAIAVGSISERNTQIATAAEEQTTVAESINSNMSAINTATIAVAQQTGETAQSSEQVDTAVTEVQKLIGQFRLGAS